VNEHERKRLVERVEREGATVGQRVPTEIALDGEPFALREFVVEVGTAERVTPEQRETVEEMQVALRTERTERMDRLEDGDITYDEGEALVASIVGIDRALNALQQLEQPDLEAEAKRQEAADRKRWFSFLREALGHDEDTDGRAARPGGDQ
jgi:hypothetical protein